MLVAYNFRDANHIISNLLRHVKVYPHDAFQMVINVWILKIA